MRMHSPAAAVSPSEATEQRDLREQKEQIEIETTALDLFPLVLVFLSRPQAHSLEARQDLLDEEIDVVEVVDEI